MLLQTALTTATAAEIGQLHAFGATTGRLELALTAHAVPVTIGGYKVPRNDSLEVCDKSGAPCADPYAGALLHLEPGETLAIDLSNQLDAKNVDPGDCMAMHPDTAGLLNLHTHGLLVTPYAHTAATPPVFGDTVFHCVAKGIAGGNIVDGTIRYDIALGPKHPLGIDWIHPHVHGLAKQQVASGMASMIEVGTADKLLCARPTGSFRCTPITPDRIKHLMLKDAQLVQRTPEQVADNAYENFVDQDSDFCGVNKYDLVNNLGECALDKDNAALPPFLAGRWVFTLNGQKHPNWDIPADGFEIWRIQNASANVTYRLSLQAPAPGPGVAAKVKFQVLNMDGAGLAPTGTTFPAALPDATDLLLMPSSRVDLLVQTPAENTRDAIYALVDDNVQAGSAVTDADIWPHIELATITLHPNHAALTAVAPPPAPPPPTVRALTLASEKKLTDDLKNNCAGLDAASPAELKFYHDHLALPYGWRRRVYFGVNGAKFALRATLVGPGEKEFDLLGHPIAPGDSLQLSTFTQSGDHTALCVRKNNRPEIWELVNVSNEVHNFHIHQLKFRIVRKRDGLGTPVMRTPSPLDAVRLPGELLFRNGYADLQHDVVIVPRGSSLSTDAIRNGCSDALDPKLVLDRSPANHCQGTDAPGDLSGMIQVSMTFDGAQLAAGDDGAGHPRPAKFVFHCHILEHEDKGMMAGITVIDPDAYR